MANQFIKTLQAALPDSVPLSADDYDKQMRLAEMLRQRSEEPLNGQMVSGRYVAPSWTQGLANSLNAYAANNAMSKADAIKQKRLDDMAALVRGATTPGMEARPEQWKVGDKTFASQQEAESAAAPQYSVNGTPFKSRQEAEQYIAANDPRQELGNALYGEFGGREVLPNNVDFSQYAGTPFMAPDLRPQMGIDSAPGGQVSHVPAQAAQAGGFDIHKLMTAAAQDPRNPMFGQALQYFALQQDANKPENLFGKVMPSSYTPASLAKYQQSRNFADLVPVSGGMNFGNVNPGQFTPESLSVYAQTGNYADLVPRMAPVQIDQGGYKTLLDPGTRREKVYPVTPKPEDMPSFKGAQATATEQAKAGVERSKEVGEKARNADALISYIDEADNILKQGQATGSMIGAGLAAGKKAFGVSDASTQANQRLENIGAWMTANVPRMQGPQSDADRKYYQQMAAQVGDKTVPINDRRAALRQLRVLQEKYKTIQGGNAPAGAPSIDDLMKKHFGGQ